MKKIYDLFFTPRKNAYPVECHVVVTDSSSGNTMVHIWKGDNLDNANSIKLTSDQVIKLRDALIDKFGV